MGELHNLPISSYEGASKSRRLRWVEHIGCIRGRNV